MTNIRVGSLVFQSGDGSEGFFIDDKGITGLTGGLGVRSDSVEIPQGFGEFDVPVFRSARIVSVKGTCAADSPERLDYFAKSLSGVLAGGQSGRVVFDMPGGPQWGDARLAGQEFDIEIWGELATYLLQLKFPNPRLFGESRTFAGSTPAYHYGNFTAAPVITVTGSAPSGYTINGPAGKKYIVTAPLVAGTPHVIDMADGYLRVGGVIVSGAVSRADTWGIPGGASVAVTVTPVSGSASVSQLVTDTFL